MLVNARAGQQARAGRSHPAACSCVATTRCTAHFRAATDSGGACAGAALTLEPGRGDAT
jgi:hypothetical protein